METQMLSVRVPTDQKQRLKVILASRGTTLQEFVLLSVNQRLSRLKEDLQLGGSEE